MICLDLWVPCLSLWERHWVVWLSWEHSSPRACGPGFTHCVHRVESPLGAYSTRAKVDRWRAAIYDCHTWSPISSALGRHRLTQARPSSQNPMAHTKETRSITTCRWSPPCSTAKLVRAITIGMARMHCAPPLLVVLSMVSSYRNVMSSPWYVTSPFVPPAHSRQLSQLHARGCPPDRSCAQRPSCKARRSPASSRPACAVTLLAARCPVATGGASFPEVLTLLNSGGGVQREHPCKRASSSKGEREEWRHQQHGRQAPKPNVVPPYWATPQNPMGGGWEHRIQEAGFTEQNQDYKHDHMYIAFNECSLAIK